MVRRPNHFGSSETESPQVPLRARLGAVADHIDVLIATIARAAAWCLLAMVIVQVVVVLMRYVLGVGSLWLQETIIYAHATLFMLAAAWTLQQGGHVRVDIFYADAPPRRKALVDLAGTLVLLWPFAIALMALSLPYVARSWAILERSRETSGLPLVFLLKTLIPLFALLLGLQGASQAIRALTVLVGDGER
jgi:TRAP-type mannitol/chloroaromatic compound transport system permease small subunit